MKKIIARIVLVAALILIPSWKVMCGGGGSTYYASVTANATPTGGGTVYVNPNGNNTDSGGAYAQSSTGGNGTRSSGANVDVYLFARASSGYHFVGWNDSASASGIQSTSTSYTKQYRAATKTKQENAATYSIYAVFAHNTFTVSFNAGGGSGSMSDQTFTYGTAQNLRTNTFTNNVTITYDTCGGSAIAPTVQSRSFTNWSSSYDGPFTNGQDISNLQVITTSDQISLTANWGNASVTLPTPTKTPADGIARTFEGWYTAASGGTKIGDAGATVQFSANTTLYAHWQEYDLTISASGGSTGETAVFTVTRSGSPALTYTIPVVLGSSTVLKGLPGGTYSVVPSTDWRWDYTISPASYTGQTVGANRTFTFTFSDHNTTAAHDERSRNNVFE